MEVYDLPISQREDCFFMSDTILKINNLTKTYGAKTVLDNVSFEIKRGRIYGFIGENGAGKTTALERLQD